MKRRIRRCAIPASGSRATNSSKLNGRMYFAVRSHRRPGIALLLFVCTLFLSLAASPLCRAQTTRLWTQSSLGDFENGTPQGVALTSDGQLREAPALTPLLTTPSTFVWSVAADKSGNIYLGTGSPAAVLRVGPKPDGKPFALFETTDLSVQVVRIGPDGYLYAATMPSGKVYRFKPDATTRQDESSATLVFDASSLDGAHAHGSNGKNASHYIWDMTFDAAGRLYIATGGPGAVYRVDPSKPEDKPEEFFRSDEAHIRALAWDAAGNLIAGSDGTGLIYRINPQGKGYVLFEAPRREITSLAIAADGAIYAACVGEKNRNPLPPLPVQGIASATITIIQPGSLQAANASSSLPEGTDIFALAKDQAPRKLWSSKDDIVYALAARPGGLLALSGNRGRIYSIQSDGNYADVGHLQALQGLSLAAEPGAAGSSTLLIGTGNTGKLYRFGTGAEKHEYASSVLDAGALAQFGRVEIEPGSSNYEIWTRTGNVEQPVRGWSDWEPLKDDVVASPAGRFLQWKAVLHPGGAIGSVGVNYLPVNSAPVVDDLVVVPGARVTSQSQTSSQQTVNIAFGSGVQTVTSDDGSSTGAISASKDRTAITVRWAAHDDDGDNLVYSIYLRGDGETVWRLLRKNLTDKVYSFDATLIPDGGYQVKVVASDAPSHTPGGALTGDRVSNRFVVDTTPPAINDLKTAQEAGHCAQATCPQSVRLTLDAADATSPIAHAEYSLDAGPWQFIAPVGQISDSRTEHYDVLLPAASLAASPGEHLITVRVYDRYENVGVAKTVFHTVAK